MMESSITYLTLRSAPQPLCRPDKKAVLIEEADAGIPT